MLRKGRVKLEMIGLLVVALAIATGCGSSSSSSTSVSLASGTTTSAKASGAPIVIGNVGIYSGPIGAEAVLVPTLLQTWADGVNAQGGINGHPVKIISQDNGGDTTKSVTEIQNQVANDHVIAFTANMTVQTTPAGADYLLQKHIPVVGGDSTVPTWFTNPMFFALGPNLNVIAGALAPVAKSHGVTRMAIWECNQGAPCASGAKQLSDGLAKVGIPVVNRQVFGLAQDSYGANCLAAQQAKADGIMAVGDSPTVSRIMNSCAHIGYHPTYLEFDAQAGNAYLSAPGAHAFITQQWFPWFLTSGSPGLDAWGKAIKSAPSSEVSDKTAAAWASLQLLDTALRTGVPKGGTPTSQEVLNGLYSVHGDTLGGLTVPLTFHRGQPSPAGNCWIVGELKDGKFGTPNGTTAQCA